jgi:hypothetical protein
MNSAVVWNDENQGVVLHLAKGENGIAKLGIEAAEKAN